MAPPSPARSRAGLQPLSEHPLSVAGDYQSKAGHLVVLGGLLLALQSKVHTAGLTCLCPALVDPAVGKCRKPRTAAALPP